MAPALLKKLSKLLRQPTFSAAEARKVGVHPSVLAYYCNKGVLERVSRGYYRSAGSETGIAPEWEDAVLIARSVKNGVLCLITALVYYGLTEEFARNVWVAVPRSSRAPRRTNARIVRFANMTLGVQATQFGIVKVKMFDRERTVIDSFRYLSRETAIKALKRYLKPGGDYRPDISKLNRYAKILRTDISAYIEATLT